MEQSAILIFANTPKPIYHNTSYPKIEKFRVGFPFITFPSGDLIKNTQEALNKSPENIVLFASEVFTVIRNEKGFMYALEQIQHQCKCCNQPTNSKYDVCKDCTPFICDWLLFGAEIQA